MLAQREDLDILHNNELVVVLMEDSTIDNVTHVLLVSFGEEEHGLCISIRRITQSFALRVFSYAFKNSLHGS